MGTHNAHGPRPTCARFASPEAGQRPELYRMRNPPFPPLIYHKDCPNLLTHECERPAEGPKSEVVLSILRAHHQESNHVHFRTHTPTRHHPRANGPRAPGRNRRARPTKTEGANYAASTSHASPAGRAIGIISPSWRWPTSRRSARHARASSKPSAKC